MKNARIVAAEVPRGRSNEKIKAVWDRNLTMVFCDLCIKEKDHNSRRGNYFKKEGWSRLVANFYKETGKEYEKSQLKNRWDLLKKEWKIWKQLKGNDTSLCWDPNKNNINTSEAWWEEKLKLIPEATKFKNGGIDPELETKLDWMFQGIYNDVTLTPAFGIPMIDGTDDDDDDEPPKVEVQEVVAVEDIQMPEKAMSEHLNEIDNPCIEQNPQAHSESEHQSEPPLQKKRSPETDSSHLNKDKEKVPKLAGRVSKLSRQIDRFCSAAESISTATSAKFLTLEPYSIPEAIRLLNNMEEEVPKKSELYFFALDLFLNKDKRTVFISLETDIRAWWLKMEMEHRSKVCLKV